MGHEQMNKQKFLFIISLQEKQSEMLKGKEECLNELYDICDNDEQRTLVKHLIIDFSEMNDDIYNLCLMDMKNAIINKGYPLEDCLVIAMAHDHMPDSSEEVLQDIKLHLCMKGFPSRNFCNRIDHCMKREYKNIHHFFVVDDFIGSGTTVMNRKKFLEKQINDREYTLHFVVVAGMVSAINKLNKLGIDVYCSYQMSKGISSKYQSTDVGHRLQLMADLEAKLAPKINNTLLSTHHFGYKQSEALFCRRNKNIPNNVFPLFWWKKDANDINRQTLYTRIQDGY